MAEVRDTTATQVESAQVERPAEVVSQSIQAYQPYIPVATQIGPARPSGLPQASFAAAMGQPKALRRLAVATTLRAGLIAGALYAVGVRKPSQLIVGSLASSASLSLMLTGYHAARARRTW